MTDRFALRTRIRRGRVDAYLRAHTRTPLDLDDDLKSLGVIQWRIWRHGRDLFHEVLIEDRARFSAGLASSSVQAGWRSHLEGILERRGAGVPMSLVWELE